MSKLSQVGYGDKPSIAASLLFMIKQNEKSRWVSVFIFCLFLAFLLLLIATKSSPLYPFNDWVDTNASFTMGKGLMNGRVLYRDLFDQRGPYLYLIYGLAYLISNTTFIGVFVLEVISLSVFLFFSYKIFRLFLDQKYALIALPLLCGSVVNLRSFAQGGSAEEFTLPLVMISLYYLIRYYQHGPTKSAPNRWFLINGLIAGCVLWIKFSFLGFWIGWMGAVLIGLILKKEFRRVLKSILAFLAGILIAALPWIVYFAVHHSISVWLQSYFIVNLTAYSERISIFERINFLLINIISHLSFNPLAVGLMIVGIYVFIKTKKYIGSLSNRLGYLSCVILLAFSVYGGGRGYIYYFLIFAPFIVFGLMVLLKAHYEEFGSIQSGQFVINVCLIALIGILVYTYQVNQNTYMLQINKEDLVQFRFAEIINQQDDPTLLNYGWLDSGFYTATGIYPNLRFFYRPNFEHEKFPLIMDEQNRYIRENLVDFVVISYPLDLCEDGMGISHLNKNYQLIAKERQVFEDTDFYYLLYKAIE